MSYKIIYRLEPVLNQKRELQKEATKYLALLQKKLYDIENEIQELKNKILQKEQDKKDKKTQFFELFSKEGMMANSINNHNAEIKSIEIKIDGLNNEIKQKTEEKDKIIKEIDIAKDRLMEATKELKTFEKHKENYIKEQTQILQKKEQKEMDEISNLIHNFKNEGDD